MFKWYFKKLDNWIAKHDQCFDLEEDKINHVTVKDAWGIWKLSQSPVLWLFLLPFIPVFILFELFEFVAGLVLIVAGVVFLISFQRILVGQGTLELVLACLGSGVIFLGYFIGYPLIRRTPRYKRFKNRWL